MPLPGVVLSLLTPGDAPTNVADVTSSAPDGSYTLKAPGSGRYTVKAELTAFAASNQDVTIDATSCRARVDISMVLASRARPSAVQPSTEARAADQAPAGEEGRADGRPGISDGGRGAQPATGGRGRTQTAASARGRAPQDRRASGGASQDFQNLQLLADQNGLARVDESTGPDSAQLLLPPGFSPDTAAESVATIGNAQVNTAFDPRAFAEQLRGLGGGPFGDGVGGGPGGRGGGPGGFGGPGGGGPLAGLGGIIGRGRGNQIRGNLSQTVETSALDAAPYALNGQTKKPDYLQQRINGTIGGPLSIPKVIDSPRTFFFVNYAGNHSRNPFDTYSTVPTIAERTGDLSGLSRRVVDPTTHLPFSNNQIPPSAIDPASQHLLSLIPTPNQPGDVQNFHTVTTTTSQLDDVNVRLVRTFGAPPPRQGGPGGRGGPGGGRGGAFGGRGGSAAGASNLNVGIHYRRSDNTNANPFPTLGGTSNVTAWDMPVGYTFTKKGMLNSLRFGFNHQRAESQNLYAFTQDVAGQAGILGASPDPFDWGAPTLSFTNFQGVRDVSPSTRIDQTVSVGDSTVKIHGQHTIRFGGDYRDIRTDSRADPNARGSFVFTGLYTGLDFADFLLGLPQLSSVQYGPGLERFRARSWDLFLQDDWRATSKLTINAGVRYEYYAPYSEDANRLVTLDVAPGFTAAVAVEAGAVGPYSGVLPDTIVHGYHSGLAPRVGIAWRAWTSAILRASYGINYNSSVYQSIAQQLAGQPPFAAAGTLALAPGAAPVPLEVALQNVNSTATSNTYAVDPNYRLPFVQIWNTSLQRDLTRTVTMDVSYTGSRGSNLDVVRAPNRNPDGTLRISGVGPFLWESSEGYSILNSVTVRARKRMSNGFAASASYTLSKSIDDASSIAGGAVVVAQNDQDLAAERGLSSFDQRHRLTVEATCDLPFGEDKHWLTSGAAAALLGHWQLNTSVQLASGTPFTARVLGGVRDVSTGVNGTLRANYNGEPIAAADPTTTQFFNTAAFTVPPPGTFGDAGRNTIIGPGTSTVNLSVLRTVSLGQTRSLSIQILANNLLNDVQYGSIDAIVNSPTFGHVTSVRPMRRVQFVTRFRF
jgi:hypothetical protein